MKIIDLSAYLREHSYPGRGILLGRSADNKHAVIAYFIMGRSANSRNRVFTPVAEDNGIMTEAYDPSKMEDPSLIIYHPVRYVEKTGDTVVTNGEEFPASKAFCRELARRVPEVTTIVQNVNTRQTNVILGEKERVLFGPGFILDTLCGLTFRISSQSFYQVNATQTEVLYNEAIRLANLTGAETVIDAYCGTGTIGLVAARRGAARVIGVDSVPSAIRDAANNARHNGVENAEFIAQDATAFMRELAASGERPQPLVLLMDPPRAGSTPEFLEAAAALAPERIVYISCNPTTQARDVRQLVESGYEVRAIRPVDMFPHTDHVESIVMLEKKND